MFCLLSVCSTILITSGKPGARILLHSRHYPQLRPNKLGLGGAHLPQYFALISILFVLALQVAVVQFINAMVTSPEELDMRIHLRNECNAAGFNEIVRLLRQVDSEELRIQLDVFEDEMLDDWAELVHRFRDTQVDLQDMGECFSMLQNLVAESPAEPYLLSILQHLLLIRDDHVARCVLR